MFSGDSLQTKYLLELILSKNQVIAETVDHLASIPEVKRRCEMLLDSLKEELRATSTEIQTFLQQPRTANSPAKHDYVIEFYDSKIRQLQSVIDGLTLDRDNQHKKNEQVLLQMQQELLQLRMELGEREQATNGGEVQLRVHIQELEKALAEKEHERLLQMQRACELKAEVEAMQKEVKGERAGSTVKLLEVNRSLDETKLHFLHLVQQLQTDNQTLHRQILALQQSHASTSHQLITKTQSLHQKQLQIGSLTKEIQNLTAQLNTVKRSLDKKYMEYKELVDWRENCERELEKSEERVRKMELQMEDKINMERTEVDGLKQENKDLVAMVEKMGMGVRELERVLEATNIKVRQLESDKRMFLDQIQHRKQECYDTSNKLKLANDTILKLQQQIEQQKDLLNEAYKTIQRFEKSLEDTKVQSNRQQQRHHIEKQQIRKQYQESIAQLLKVAKQMQSQTIQLQSEVKEKQNQIEELNEKIDRMEVVLEDSSDKIESMKKQQLLKTVKMDQVKSEKCLLQQELQCFKRKSQKLEKQLRQANILLQQLALAKDQLRKCTQRLGSYEKQLSIVQQSNKKQIQTQKKLINKDKENLQSKIKLLKEQVSLKTLETASLSTRNRSLEEEIVLLKKQNMIEKNRQQAKVLQLQRMLREKREFQAKVAQLYV